MEKILFRKAQAEEVPRLTEMSKAAFDTDVQVGGSEPGGPPDYDSLEWHRKMTEEGHLYTFLVEEKITGGALLSRDGKTLYVGRIFIDPSEMKKGFGLRLMQEAEKEAGDAEKIVLDTPIWNIRTNAFYRKLGYKEVGRDEEFVYYQKALSGKLSD